jgi:SPP1 gp7 family putative phage head morphogenesis protein
MTLEKNFKQAEKAAEEQQQQAEQETIQAYREYLKEVRAEVGFNYEKFAVAGALTWAIMMKGNRLTKLEKAIASEASKLYTKTKNVTEEAIKDVFSECYYRTGWTMETGAGVSLGFDILNPDVVEAAILNPYDRITWPERMKANTEVMVRQIREEITRGIIQGKAYGQTARAITERINVGASKAIRIVQTETGRAQSQGTQAAFEKASKEGLVFKKVWVSTLDIRTRDKHRSLDGQKVDPDEPFKYGSMTAMYPRGWGVPEMDINCRCTHRAEIEGMEPTSRRARNPATGKNEVIPNMTYEEWYESRVKTDPKALLAEKMYKNRFADKKQHEAYKKVLGKDAPSSFEKFQKLKYNDVNAWEDLKGLYSYIGRYPDSNKTYYEINKQVSSLKETGLLSKNIGIVVRPVKRKAISVSPHAAKQLTSRGISINDANDYIANAQVMFIQAKGQRCAYYSNAGAAVVMLDGNVLKTAFPRSHYDEGAEALMEVLKNNVR